MSNNTIEQAEKELKEIQEQLNRPQSSAAQTERLFYWAAGLAERLSKDSRVANRRAVNFIFTILIPAILEKRDEQLEKAGRTYDN